MTSKLSRRHALGLGLGAVAMPALLRGPAQAQGGRVVEALTTWEYGERSGVVEDIGGHRWELTQTVRDVSPEEWGGETIAPW